MATVARWHAAHRLARAVVNTENIRRKEIADILIVDRINPEVGELPGIIDQHIDRAKGLIEFAKHRDHLLKTAHIGPQCDSLAASLANLCDQSLRGRFAVQVVHAHAIARLRGF